MILYPNLQVDAEVVEDFVPENDAIRSKLKDLLADKEYYGEWQSSADEDDADENNDSKCKDNSDDDDEDDDLDLADVAKPTNPGQSSEQIHNMNRLIKRKPTPSVSVTTTRNTRDDDEEFTLPMNGTVNEIMKRKVPPRPPQPVRKCNVKEQPKHVLPFDLAEQALKGLEEFVDKFNGLSK